MKYLNIDDEIDMLTWKIRFIQQSVHLCELQLICYEIEYDKKPLDQKL